VAPSSSVTTRAQPVDGDNGADSQRSTRIGFDRAESWEIAPSPACRSSETSVSTCLMTALEPQQPGYLSHSDAATAPLDGFTQR
jgi:hypothetical protein